MKHNRRVPLRWLAFAVLMTALVSSVTLSRFMTTASGSDSARAAKFSVTVNHDDPVMNINTGKSPDKIIADTAAATYTFTVSSNSEVALEYKLTLIFPDSVPAGVSLTLDGKALTTSDNTEFTSEFYRYDPENPSESHTLTITADYDTMTEDFRADGITVRITAQQID